MPAPHAFRYPGSKTKLIHAILGKLPDHLKHLKTPLLYEHISTAEYREPFFGSGAVGLTILYALPEGSKAWINDADRGVAHYWQTVQQNPQALINLIQACEQPTVALYQTCMTKATDATLSPSESAFITLLLHQCSYSGLGKKAGGPIGGMDQQGAYKIHCRWHPERLIKDIQHCHQCFARLDLTITHGDFAPVFQAIHDPGHTFFYCDPPYVKRGPELYAESMEKADHERLSKILHQLRSPWVLSYDDHSLVKNLYHDCHIEPLTTQYTVSNGTNGQGVSLPSVTHELLITPKQPAPRIRHGSAIIVTGKTGYEWTRLSRETGISIAALRNRVRRGWSIEEATVTPQRTHQHQREEPPSETGDIG